MKSIRQAKIQKINTTSKALEMALMNYRAKEGHWPNVSGGETSTNAVTSFKGAKNAQVFAPLIENSKRVYLDPAALLTKVSGLGVVPLREAMERKVSAENCPIGYPNPDKGSEFKYYKVSINTEYDTVKVEP